MNTDARSAGGEPDWLPKRCSTYTLGQEDQKQARAAIRSLVPEYASVGFDEFYHGCELAARKLPLSIRQWAEAAKLRRVGVLRNLPIDESLIPTPTAKRAVDNVSMFSDAVISTIASLFGAVYTIEGKNGGRHIHNIYPVIGDEYTQLGSSKVELDWHVEEAFHPARPSWLALLCLRSDPMAVTKVARTADLELSDAAQQTLRSKAFKLRIDDTYAISAADVLVPTAVLAGPAADPAIILDPAYTEYDSRAAEAAVAEVVSAAAAAQQCFTLTEGDLLVFNNRKTVHSRSQFSPRMDGTDRWLKRAFILEPGDWAGRIENGYVPFAIA